MLVSLNWLKEWVDIDLDNTELSNRLTMSGLEVAEISPVVEFDAGVVVGLVKIAKSHSTLEHLTICTVDAGQKSDIQVVCGAPDVTEGMKYPVALTGSKVGKITVQERSFDGEPSTGMLCSAGELGMEDSSDSLMELDSAAPIGCSINRYLQLPDSVLDIELTPNRADCLSIRGVAREVAIIVDESISTTPIESISEESSSTLPVTVQDNEDCPIYCGRIIENINPNAKTPDWMAARLNRVGLRCIHPIVDVTNYVMIELGQPMHAFDTDIFDASEIIVRRSNAGEKLVLLDGEELDLGSGILLITDTNGPNGLAGVMGGRSSGIRPETKNIFLEAAFFSPRAIRRSVSRFGKHTDASHRFERGVDPGKQAEAMERATGLIKEITGGIPGPLNETINSDCIPAKQPCEVRESRIERILGLSITRDRIDSILRSVNHQIGATENGWNVVPPSYRFDLEKEYDQIEEIARIYGYDKIPSTITVNMNQSHCAGISESIVKETSIRELLHHHGYFEAITYSFVDPGLQSHFRPDAVPKMLANPLSEDMSAMRTSLWPGLLGAFLENYRRNKNRIRLYEIGRVFLPENEIDMIGGLCFGMAAPQQWGVHERVIDFFDVKGDLLALLDLTGRQEHFEVRAESCDGLHPGCSAGVYLKERHCGTIGQIHPDLTSEISDEDNVFVFELELDVLTHRNLNRYQPISRFPPVMRDISILVPKDTQVADISNAIADSNQENLENCILFDVYCGTGIDLDLKSVAYRLTFRSHGQTLTDDVVNSSLQTILTLLNKKFGAQLREQAV